MYARSFFGWRDDLFIERIIAKNLNLTCLIMFCSLLITRYVVEVLDAVMDCFEYLIPLTCVFNARS